MRPLRLGLVWAAAAWVALTVLVRIARGEVVVISSYAAPVVRLVALVLVFLGACAEKLRPGESAGADPQQPGSQAAGSQAPTSQPGDLSQGTDPAKPPDEPPVATVEPPLVVKDGFPDELTQDALVAMFEWVPPRGLWSRMGESRADLGWLTDRAPPPLAAKTAREAFTAQVEAFTARRQKGEPETATTLRQLLAAAEAVPLYDAWFAGLLWAHARALQPAPTDLYARLERHLRVTHALVRAQQTTGPVEFSAWRSKAGPPKGWRGLTVPPGLAAAARKEFDAGVDAGLWETGATLTLKVTQGSVVLVRRGVETRVEAGAGLRLRRLDVVRSPTGATLQAARLGDLVVPAGGELTAWTAGERLTPAARTKLGELVAAALKGDAAALTRLEELLPAAHAAIREAAQREPSAPGAAGLRTLLTAFDE